MTRPRSASTSSRSALLLVALLLWQTTACAQACCAGAAAITPARLELHEGALAGVQPKAALVFGNFDARGGYRSSPAGAKEWDFTQNFFGALRVVDRAQVAVTVPFVETWRASHGISETGGGVGDVTFSARYDATLAGASAVVPGLGVLAGASLPTGRSPEDSSPSLHPLATDATGLGVYQVSAGAAVEQLWDPWLVSATGIVAWRAPRTVGALSEKLGPQYTLIAAGAYTFPGEWAVAALASLLIEPNATIDGRSADGTSRKTLQLGAAVLAPSLGNWRAQASVVATPPFSKVSENTPASAGVTFSVIYAWLR